MSRELDIRLARVAALGEPVRRALYRFVARQPDAVTREEAAEGVDVALHTAKFHLDKLVADGLLAAEYRRPPGRGGPGAGRPAKVYRCVGELEVSVPERRYDLAGHILVRAVGEATASGEAVVDAVARCAHETGRELTAGQVPAARAPMAARRRAAVGVLEGAGFEPERRGGRVELANCPFHRLAVDDPTVVCTMAEALVRGVLDGAGVPVDNAVLDPSPTGDRCCVTISDRTRPASR